MIGIVVLALTGGVLMPASAAEYPTWSEVENARRSEQATTAEIDRITGLLNDLKTRVEKANALVATRGEEFQIATDLLDEATGRTANLREETEEASSTATAAKVEAGRLAAQVARGGGGGDTALNLFFAGDKTDDLLERLGMSSKLTEQNESVFDRATRAAQNADSLAAQADIVQKELDRLAATAQNTLDAAAAAQAEAETALTEQQGVEAQLTAQLEALRDSRISIEQGYQTGEQNRLAAEAAAAAAAAAVRGPAAARSPATQGRPASSSAVSGSGWTSPITSYNAYQGYGMRLHPVYKEWRLHSGDDYSAPCGTPMFATSGGTVSYAGPAGGYGNQIRIDHGGGMSSSYSHIDTGGMIVRTGATVTAGQQIAVVGNSGVSTGCHLHFEIRQGGVAISPRPFLQTQGVG